MQYGLVQTLINLRGDMIRAAKKGQTITYKSLMKKHGVPRGNRYGTGIGWLVGHVSEYEHKNGRPLLSSIVVKSGSTSKSCPKGHPGWGFFRIDGIPPNLGRSTHDDRALSQREKAFVFKTQQKVWAYWRRHSPPRRPLIDFLNR